MIDTDTQMEWMIYDDRVDTFPRHCQLRPTGVYAHPTTFELYQFFYGSITEVAEFISSGKIPKLT